MGWPGHINPVCPLVGFRLGVEDVIGDKGAQHLCGHLSFKDFSQRAVGSLPQKSPWCLGQIIGSAVRLAYPAVCFLELWDFTQVIKKMQVDGVSEGASACPVLTVSHPQGDDCKHCGVACPVLGSSLCVGPCGW